MMAHAKSFQKPTELTRDQRVEVFDTTAKKVVKNYFDPNYNGTDWPSRARTERDRIVAMDDPDAFELAMHDLVRLDRLATDKPNWFAIASLAIKYAGRDPSVALV